jgi:nicotinamidase-related amidase
MKEFNDKTALLIIDVQKGFDESVWGERNNPEAEENIAKLLQLWRETKRPAYHVRHLSREPGSPLYAASNGSEIKDIVTPLPGEPIITKDVNSAFIGTDLEEQLKTKSHYTLVIVGLTTDHCVSTTTRMAANLGFNTFIVSDATAAFDRVGPSGEHYKAEEIHSINLASLDKEFAKVINTKDVEKMISY